MKVKVKGFEGRKGGKGRGGGGGEKVGEEGFKGRGGGLKGRRDGEREGGGGGVGWGGTLNSLGRNNGASESLSTAVAMVCSAGDHVLPLASRISENVPLAIT